MFKFSRSISNCSHSKIGLLLGIDGVVTKARNRLLPRTHEAFKMLHKNNIPFMFVSNCEESEIQQALKLSRILKPYKIRPEQIVTAHSALRSLPNEFQSKRVLLVGQGSYINLANRLGFNKTTTIDEVLESFPEIDTVSWTKRQNIAKLVCICLFTAATRFKITISKINEKPKTTFKRIESILLMGTPTHWETSLQVVLDVIVGNGIPFNENKRLPKIPLIFCNGNSGRKYSVTNYEDDQLGFIKCLKFFHEQVTSAPLEIDYCVGKPFPTTYRFAINQFTKQFGRVDRFFCMGSRVNNDVVGANRYKIEDRRVKSVLVGNKNKFNSRIYDQSKEENRADYHVDCLYEFIRDIVI